MLVVDGSTIVVFIAYLLCVFGIAVWSMRRTSTAADYFLGGRTLSPGVSAVSAGASDMSGWLLLGLPGFAYSAGMQAAWIAVGLCLGVAANWLLMARRLRILSAYLDNALTVPTYLQRRFNSQNIWLRLVPAVFILVFFLFYVSAGLIGGGKLFSTVFAIDYRMSVLIGALVILGYTLLGGFLAVSWSDVFQGLLMMLALVIVPWVVIGDLDGITQFADALRQRNPQLLNPLRDITGQPLGVLAIVSLLAWGLGYFGQPHILARFKAIRSDHETGRAAVIGILWALTGYSLAVLVGLCGVAVLDQPLLDSERVFMVLVGVFFHPLVAGVMLAAILAAIMSTVDSQLLVCSAALAEDIYPLVAKKQLKPQRQLLLARFASLLLAIIATLIALDPESSVLQVVAYAWAGLGAALGPALLISLYWKRMSDVAALAGILVGGVTVIIWNLLQGGLFDVYELAPAFLFSCIAVYVTGLVTRPGSTEFLINGLASSTSRG